VDRIQIRPVTASELDLMVDWAAAEGWNPGLDDAEAFLAADPGGFLMGFVDGGPAACISGINYGEDFSFLGFYICRSEYRGQGFGMALWNACIARLGDRIIGLDGVVDQQANYAKSGFVLAHRNIRYGGFAGSAANPSEKCVELNESTAPELVPAIVAYDKAFFAGPRETFLRNWISNPRRTVAYVENGAIRGYATARACRNGSKIGPLFADNDTVAEELFLSLCTPLSGQPIFLDLPETNPAAMGLAERHGLSPVFETARMYRGPAPDLPLKRIFGITTFELG
jgi:GNAT superfamily N-acetyltransferase